MDTATVARAARGADQLRIGDKAVTESLVGKGVNTNVKQAINEMIHEALKERQTKKLTWNRNNPPEVSQEGVVGLWNPNLEGCRFFVGRAYEFRIQNYTLLNTQGEEIDPETIPEEPEIWRDKAGIVIKGPSPREVAITQLAEHRAQARARDEMLCKYCDFRAQDEDDRMRHCFKEHAKEFAQIVGMETKPAEPAPLPAEYVCDCGKRFASQHKLSSHRRFARIHGAPDAANTLKRTG